MSRRNKKGTGPTSPVLLQASTPNEPVSAQPSIQTAQNPVSPATVESIRLNDGERALARRDEARKRKKYLLSLEAYAKTFVKGYHTAKAINDEVTVLHRKFNDVVEEMRPVFERVKYGFAHLHKGETVMGERTGTEWAKKHIGISYDWLCRCLKPPKAGRLLLTDGTKVLDPQPAKPAGSSVRCAMADGDPNNRKSKKTPAVPERVAGAETVLAESPGSCAPKPSFAISSSPIDASDAWSKEDASRRIISWVLSCLKGFSLTEKRLIVEDVISKLRDELAFAEHEKVSDVPECGGHGQESAERRLAMSDPNDGEFVPEPPARKPWFSMTRDEQKQYAAERLRETLAAKRAAAELASLSDPAEPEKTLLN